MVAAKRFASKQLKVHKAHAVAKFLVEHLEPLCVQSVLLLKSLQITSVYQAQAFAKCLAEQLEHFASKELKCYRGFC